MKKYFCITLVVFLLLNLTACVTVPNSNINEPITTSTNDAAPVKPVSTTINEVVLVDMADIKITAKELSNDGLFGAELKILIENNSTYDLTVQARNASVNGYMIETMLSADVAAGKKANDELIFSATELEACGIETIADIEFAFHIFNTEDWNTYLDTDLIQVKTSAADSYVYTYDDSGMTVYDENKLKIVAKGISEEDSFFGPGLILYMYNSGDRSVSIQTRDVSINGFMVESIFSVDIMPGKHAVSSVTFMNSDLENNSITEITDLELSFHIFDSNTWETIADTDKVSLDFATQ